MNGRNDEPEFGEIDARELEKFRQLKDHPEIGTARAMDYCVEHQVMPPRWLVEASACLIIDLLKREKTSRRGRLAGALARFRQELFDAERWDSVLEVRRIRAMADSDIAALKFDPDYPATDGWKRRFKKRADWLKLGTFECAARLLLGRDAHASAHAVRASYRKIERRRKSDPDHAVGAWFNDEFLRKLGLEGMLDRKPGHKTFLFF